MNTSLHDENTFYQVFLRDLRHAKHEVIIESPFITNERLETVWSALSDLKKAGVKVYIITRDPKEHTDGYEIQSEEAMKKQFGNLRIWAFRSFCALATIIENWQLSIGTFCGKVA